MKKENQRIKLTKRLLRDALLQLLKKKPIQKINVSELCETAGINRATFYRHYSVPQDILIEMENTMSNEARHLFPTPKNLTEFKADVIKLCKYIDEKSDTIKILIKHELDLNIMKLFYDSIYEVLKSAEITSNNNVLDTESIELITAYCAGGGYHMMRKWLMDDIKKSPEEIAETIIALLGKNITRKT